jgi:iron complex outermembrane receptor protein
VGASVLLGSGNWVFRSSLRHSFKQDDIASFEESSPAYTNLSATLLIDLPIPEGVWHLVISGDNLLDEEIRSHTSPLKEVAPAPGRSLRVNLSVQF